MPPSVRSYCFAIAAGRTLSMAGLMLYERFEATAFEIGSSCLHGKKLQEPCRRGCGNFLTRSTVSPDFEVASFSEGISLAFAWRVHAAGDRCKLSR